MTRRKKKDGPTFGPLGYRTDIPGFSVRRTGKGITVIEIDAWADPRKDDVWMEKQRRGSPSDVIFRREFLRDWTSAAGESFYPEFVARPELYVRECRALINAPVVRGWDFGFRHPACVWLQYSPVSGRAWVLREIMPGGFTNASGRIDTGSFANLVLYLSGQIPFEAIVATPRAVEVVNEINASDSLPKAPWFGGDGTATPLRFMDWAGHEALIRGRQPAHDSKERTDADILAAKGIQLGAYYTTPKARENVIRRLLLPMKDGAPGILFDPSCKLLIEGFAGGIAYPKPTKENPDPGDPAKDGWYEHLHDALGYPLAQIAPVAEMGLFAPAPEMVLVDRTWEHVAPGGLSMKEMDGGW